MRKFNSERKPYVTRQYCEASSISLFCTLFTTFDFIYIFTQMYFTNCKKDPSALTCCDSSCPAWHPVTMHHVITPTSCPAVIAEHAHFHPRNDFINLLPPSSWGRTKIKRATRQILCTLCTASLPVFHYVVNQMRVNVGRRALSGGSRRAQTCCRSKITLNKYNIKATALKTSVKYCVNIIAK